MSLQKKLISLSNDKSIESIDLLETYLYRTSKCLVLKNDKIKSYNVIK